MAWVFPNRFFVDRLSSKLNLTRIILNAVDNLIYFEIARREIKTQFQRLYTEEGYLYDWGVSKYIFCRLIYS